MQLQPLANRQEYENLYSNIYQASTRFLDFIQTPLSMATTASLYQNQPLELIRFISQLSDMYLHTSKDRNKSIAQVLSQPALNIQFPEILAELRHALTHKSLPDPLLLRSTIQYLQEYLHENYWQIKLQCPKESFRSQLKLKLDSINSNSPLDFPVPQADQWSANVYCLDYLVGICDFHINTPDRLHQRKKNQKRIYAVTRFLMYILKQNIQKGEYNANFVKLFKKLVAIDFVTKKITQFLKDVQKEYPQLVLQEYIEEPIVKELPEIQPRKRVCLLGQRFCDAV